MVKESAAWLEASDVVPMFPTLVWKTLLKAELGDAIDANVLATLEQLRRNLPTLNPVMGGNQSKRYINATNFGISFLALAMSQRAFCDSYGSVRKLSKSLAAGPRFSPRVQFTKLIAIRTTF